MRQSSILWWNCTHSLPVFLQRSGPPVHLWYSFFFDMVTKTISVVTNPTQPSTPSLVGENLKLCDLCTPAWVCLTYFVLPVTLHKVYSNFAVWSQPRTSLQLGRVSLLDVCDSSQGLFQNFVQEGENSKSKIKGGGGRKNQSVTDEDIIDNDKFYLHACVYRVYL